MTQQLKTLLSLHQELKSLIPKKNHHLLYDGLKTKLLTSIDDYIIAQQKENIENMKSDCIEKIKNHIERIKELENLCENNNIKYSVSYDEVYPPWSTLE